MDFTLFLSKILAHYKKDLPFVVYSLPNSEKVHFYFQNDKVLHATGIYKNDCFIFSPFDTKEKSFCIPLDKKNKLKVIYKKKSILKKHIAINENDKVKTQYCKIIATAVDEIKFTKLKKVVISRSKSIELDTFDLQQLITRLLNLYPTAFSYVWYHPKTGMWSGASPELLLKTDGVSFSTMALAGTQKYREDGNYIWHRKELEEQQIVVNAISSSLQKVTSVIRLSKTYTYRAASLVHLRTDIKGILSDKKVTIAKLASVLHPTPAICGCPQKKAKKFILENENYKRKFYAGFLGPIKSKSKKSHLFVNLRCMEIKNKSAVIYVGGGITIDSIPENEWEETQHKLQTMLQVLQPMCHKE